MKILSIVCVGAGYRFGKLNARIRPKITALTVVLAVALHAFVRCALPHDVIEHYAAADRWSPALVAVALLETAGIWAPMLLIPLAVLSARIAASAYVMGAATMGALVYYRPFDVVIMNGEIQQDGVHPDYEVALVLALIFAIPSFAIGLLAKRRHRITQTPRA